MPTTILSTLPAAVQRAIDPTADAATWRRHAHLLGRLDSLAGDEADELGGIVLTLGLTRDEVALHALALAEAARLEREAADLPAADAEQKALEEEWAKVWAEHVRELRAFQESKQRIEQGKQTVFIRQQAANGASRLLRGTQRAFPALFGLPPETQLADNDQLPVALRNAMLRAGVGPAYPGASARLMKPV